MDAVDLKALTGPLDEGERTILYVTEFGNVKQLRWRKMPYPGAEVILWESPGERGTLCYLLSPSHSDVLIVWYPGVGDSQVWVVHLNGSPPARIADRADFAFWRSEGVVCVLSAPDRQSTRESVYELRAGRETHSRVDVTVLKYLEDSFASSIERVRELGRSDQLRMTLNEDQTIRATLLGLGLPPRYPIVSRRSPRSAQAVIALSPDGKHIAAYDPQQPEVVLYEVVASDIANVRERIGLSHILDSGQGESVWAEHIRWSSGSDCFTFTNVCFHPARFHAADSGPRWYDPTDWTYMVREYSLGDQIAHTVVIGRDALVTRAH